jgi:hypothetical protein
LPRFAGNDPCPRLSNPFKFKLIYFSVFQFEPVKVLNHFPTRFQLRPFLNFNTHLCDVYALFVHDELLAFLSLSTTACVRRRRRAVGFQLYIIAVIGRAAVFTYAEMPPTEPRSYFIAAQPAA